MLRLLAIIAGLHLAALALIFFPGCGIPQWRVFQKTVPTDQGPSASTVEAQRRSAALIADLSAPGLNVTVNAEGVKFLTGRIADIHAVAVPLSASLGEPLKRAQAFELPAVVEASRSSLLEAQALADKWREFSRKYAGKPLEDTGIDLAGPAGSLGLIGIVALCVAFPPIGYVLLRALPLLWGFFRRTTEAIGEFTAAHPEAGDTLKATLSRKMDAAHKTLVRRRKATV